MKKKDVDKKKINEYLEKNTPQKWYSERENDLLFFNELAYKRYNVFYKYLKSEAEFEYHRNEKVLEIGVGIGTDLISYAKNGAKVSGIDLSQEAINLTTKHFQTLGLKADNLLIADAENLPFEENYFDLVYSFGVLHHTPDTYKAVSEILRVLKPQGKFIVMLYRKGWKHYLKRLLINGLFKGQLFKYGYQETINKNTEVKGNSPLTIIFKKSEIKRMFAVANKVTIEKHRLGEFFDYAPYETIKLPAFITRIFYLFGLEKLLGENYIIKGYKKNEVTLSSNKKKLSAWEVLTDTYKNY